MISHAWKWIERGTDLLWPASLEIVVAATLLLLIAVVMHFGLRRAAASLRHRVWALTMGGLLILPLLCPILPKLPLPLSIPIAASRPTAGSPATLTPERASGTAIALPLAKTWTDSEVHPTPSALPVENPRPRPVPCHRRLTHCLRPRSILARLRRPRQKSRSRAAGPCSRKLTVHSFSSGPLAPCSICWR